MLFLLFFGRYGLAQQTQEQLALHYYTSGEFSQAAELYESLYSRAPNKYYYQMLFNSYVGLEQYREAEHLSSQRLRRYGKELDVYVDLGKVLERQGEPKKAAKQYEAAIDKIGYDTKQIGDLSQAFENAGHPEYAIKVYLQARKKMKNDYVYVSELSTLYERTGNYEAMMQEYLDLLDKQPKMINQVQISLQRALSETSNPKLAEGLRLALMERVQQHPDNHEYIEMMIWYSLQQKDFEFAMIQAKSVENRIPEFEGVMLLRVADIAKSNQSWDVALQCYQTVAQKGKDKPHYFESRVGEMDVRFSRINRNFPVPDKELLQLLNDYEKVLVDLGKNTHTILLMRHYADLLAYQADSLQKAVDLLYDILDMPKLSHQERDEAKLALGDLLLFAGEVWDASLTFMQVEKSNKNDVIGSMAKYKNAKLSYFNHDFPWAKTQLDVLRASTSKLIANDAMELSLLISDNMEEDSTYDMLEMFADADLFLFRNQLDSAWAYYDFVSTHALSHPLLDEVLLQKAKIRIKQQRYEEADSLLSLLVEQYAEDILADDGLLLQAQLNESQLGNLVKAKDCYEKIILDYPTSLYVDQARKRYGELKKTVK